MGGRIGDIGHSVQRGGDILSERFEGMSPEWQKEHEKAFERAQNEAQQHFHRCHSCNKYVCDACFNEDEGLCTECAPRQEVYVARARAEAMRRNIDEASQNATVWQGELGSRTTDFVVHAEIKIPPELSSVGNAENKYNFKALYI